MDAFNVEYEEEPEIVAKSVCKNRTLTSREKSNLMLPELLNVGTIASNNGTDQFMNYLAEMKQVEEKIRAGADIQCTEFQQRENDIEEVRSNNNDHSFTAVSENSASASTSTNPQNRFANMTFKTKLKVRGRPKRSTRQLCSFNPSQAASQAETVQSQQKKPTQKRKNCKKFTEEPVPKWRRVLQTDMCPICNSLTSHRDINATRTECCGQLIHEECFADIGGVCPDC